MASTEVQTTTVLQPEERALLLNDLSKLTPEQRSNIYVKVCASLNLNPLTQPFQYLELNGKLTLYASRNCTDQLRQNNSVSLTISSREKVDGIYVVTAKATLPNGRYDESMAAVDLMEPDKIVEWQGPSGNRTKKLVDNPNKGKQISGDALANAIMKCETKAKRRVTLCICGLSMMDETEVETVREAKLVSVPQLEAPKQPTVIEPYRIGLASKELNGKTVQEALELFGFERLQKYCNAVKEKGHKKSPVEAAFVIHCDTFLTEVMFKKAAEEKKSPKIVNPPATNSGPKLETKTVAPSVVVNHAPVTKTPPPVTKTEPKETFEEQMARLKNEHTGGNNENSQVR